jgi:hypothetical protein
MTVLPWAIQCMTGIGGAIFVYWGIEYKKRQIAKSKLEEEYQSLLIKDLKNKMNER